MTNFDILQILYYRNFIICRNKNNSSTGLENHEMTEMANFFKRLKVPKEIKSRKRSCDDGNLSIVTSAAVAQNHPNDWARHVRSPLGKVSASTVRESTSDSGLSDNDLISVSVDEPSCSVKEGANSLKIIVKNPFSNLLVSACFSPDTRSFSISACCCASSNPSNVK